MHNEISKLGAVWREIKTFDKLLGECWIREYFGIMLNISEITAAISLGDTSQNMYVKKVNSHGTETVTGIRSRIRQKCSMVNQCPWREVRCIYCTTLNLSCTKTCAGITQVKNRTGNNFCRCLYIVTRLYVIEKSLLNHVSIHGTNSLHQRTCHVV